MSVIRLPPNQPANRFYRGGVRIDDFRGGTRISASHQPEDWIASTTSVAGQHPVGLTTLPNGELLRDAVTRDPARWLTTEHRHAFGNDVKLLVKLLDAGQRLPVHAHPHVDFAASHLGRAHGKAEAWYILRGGTVHLGLRDDIDPSELFALVARQDVDSLLDLLNTVAVSPGDVVYVTPGVLHAIGEGVLILEVQEPEDLSILLEWRDFALDGEQDGHLGLGFDAVLPAVDHTALTGRELEACVHRAGSGTPLLPESAGEYFRLERISVTAPVAIQSGFAVVLVTSGWVVVADEVCEPGTVLLLDAEHPDVAVRSASNSTGELIIARPPRP